MAKKLAVVIPTFNRIELTHCAVDSVRSATPDDIIIIVVDDCGNQRYVAPNATNNSGIAVRVIQTLRNSGAGQARQLGCKLNASENIAFLDSDDTYTASWADTILHYLERENSREGGGIFIVGEVENGSTLNRYLFRIIDSAPEGMKLHIARLLILFFNPFYTPAVAMSSSICEFSSSLRFCEDYYTNFIGLFRAKHLITSRRPACVLGRKVGTPGGLSAARRNMLISEMTVRFAMLNSAHIPIIYKFVIPFGMGYQVLRIFLKASLHIITLIAVDPKPEN